MDSKITLKCAKPVKGKRPMNKNDRQKAGQNAERDLHKRFALLGLSLPLKAEPLTHENEGKVVVTTHWVRPSTWIKVLLQKAPHVLLGENNHTLQCESFWALYRQHEPTAEVFKHRSESELQRSIPILIFGDEGRGAKRGNFLVWTVESAIGLSYLSSEERACNCTAELTTLPPNDVTRSTLTNVCWNDILIMLCCKLPITRGTPTSLGISYSESLIGSTRKTKILWRNICNFYGMI